MKRNVSKNFKLEIPYHMESFAT